MKKKKKLMLKKYLNITRLDLSYSIFLISFFLYFKISKKKNANIWKFIGFCCSLIFQIY